MVQKASSQNFTVSNFTRKFFHYMRAHGVENKYVLLQFPQAILLMHYGDKFIIKLPPPVEMLQWDDCCENWKAKGQ